MSGGIGSIISIIYFYTTEKPKVDREMIHSFIFLNMIICLAMMAIGNNIASAFGLVGAVSIIRFRTSVKSARDMAFVFFTVVTGMAMGLGYIEMALIGATVIAVMILIIYIFNRINRPRKTLHYHIRISYTGLVEDRYLIENILGEIELEAIDTERERVKLLYRLVLNNISDIDQIIKRINALEELNVVKVKFLEYQ